MKQRFAFLLLVLTMVGGKNFSQVNHTLVVNTTQPKASIDKTMWGIFFEDINFGADGGIYAEMVKNRSFEFFKPMMGWTVNRKKFVEGEQLVINRGDENTRNPRFLRVTMNNAVKGDLGLTNEGFRGMGIKKGLRYDFSVLYRQPEAHTKLHIELTDTTKRVVGDTVLSLTEAGDNWHKAAVSFHANETVAKGRLNIWFEGNGTVDLDMISLFPGDTWKNRPGGMRADMVQLLADMKPGFIRFPGGCIVEGFDLTNRYRWKNTVGPIEERQLMINRWNIEFPYRNAPDYFQTFGLGFFEYFQLAEDIGAEPLPILNCGMACQFNSAELVPMKDLDPFIQDALDLVEFANGDVSTKWGKVRADMGHPAPFNLKMMGVGNENWGPQYVERLKAFQAAIKGKYPNIKLICSSGTDPNGDRFDYLNGELRKLNADFIDEHYYRKPEWFLQNARRYDNYPRTGSRVFGGEYASHVDKTVGSNRNTWLAALSEAAFMTGLERNADVVGMASYAPLFANVDGWQWAPDLIWVNNLQAYGTPDYQVQKLFSLNKGSKVVPITLNKEVVAGQDSLYASACIDAAANELIIKVVNASDKAQNNTLQLDGVKKLAAQGKLLTMQSDLTAVNSFDSPTNVAPVESTIAIKNKKITLHTAPYSFSVLRVKLE
jgi:alpha-L-arabinofuranosidase